MSDPFGRDDPRAFGSAEEAVAVQSESNFKRSSASVGDTPFSESSVILPLTCSGSKRNVIPVSVATCLTTVWMSAFSSVKGSEVAAKAGPATDEGKAQEDTRQQRRVQKGETPRRSHDPHLLHVRPT